MTIREETCLILACDLCNEDACDEDSRAAWHFETLERAADLCDEWTWTTKRQICPDCVAARTCRIFGHLWKTFPSGPEFTFCTRCVSHPDVVDLGEAS